MIERRRLTSASYHSSEESWSRGLFAEQQIAIHSRQYDVTHVARHVADKQMSCAPFFVMDVPSVVQSVHEWSDHLPRFQPHYALRCNADPVLARLLADSPGMGFEVTNTHELQLALTMMPPSQIMYSNPLWTRKAMRQAGEAGVGIVVVGSEKELMDAVAYAPESRILIAVSLDCACREESLGTASGCDSDTAENLLMTAFELRSNFAGFSFNVDNSDPGVYYKALREVRRLFGFAVDTGLRPTTVAVGGGFRAPRVKHDKERFQEVCDSLCGAVEQMFPCRQFPLLQLLASPGRFFAATAFTLCTNVIGKRAVDMSLLPSYGCDSVNSTGYVYQTNDGIYGSFGCRMADCDPECKPLKDAEDMESESVHMGTVLGPSLDGLDVAQRVFRGRQLSVGEWLLWENMGAYSMPLEMDEALPVYYFTGKDNWDSIVGRRRGSVAESTDSDGRSDGASDAESVTSDDDYDLITRFDNFFDY